MRAWFLDQEDPLEEGRATHSSILAWRIPWTEEPDGLWSTGSQRVRHDWSDWAGTFTFLRQYPKACIVSWLKISDNALNIFSTALRHFQYILYTEYRVIDLKCTFKQASSWYILDNGNKIDEDNLNDQKLKNG